MLISIHAIHAATGRHLTGICKQEPAQSAIACGPGEWQVKLHVADYTARATKVVASAGIARAQRSALVAAHRADTAGVYVLDNRESLATVRFTPVDLTIESQRKAATQRYVMLVL